MFTAILVYFQIGVYFLPGFQSEGLCLAAVKAYNSQGASYYGVCVQTSPTKLKTFEELSDESAEKTDAHFCERATEPWQKNAFCRKGEAQANDK